MSEATKCISFVHCTLRRADHLETKPTTRMCKFGMSVKLQHLYYGFGVATVHTTCASHGFLIKIDNSTPWGKTTDPADPCPVTTEESRYKPLAVPDLQRSLEPSRVGRAFTYADMMVFASSFDPLVPFGPAHQSVWDRPPTSSL